MHAAQGIDVVFAAAWPETEKVRCGAWRWGQVGGGVSLRVRVWVRVWVRMQHYTGFW